MRSRPLAVLATIAALLGAPSLAFAAGNSLSAPSVSPTSGSVTTIFSLSVSYDGKFGATQVGVSVAGLPLTMARVSGTPARGTWSVSTQLPAGTWTPTFTSLSLRGNATSLTGPTIRVASAPTPGPTVSGLSPRSGEIDTGSPGLPAEPSDAVDPGAAPAEAEPASEPSVGADPVASIGAGPSPGTGGGTSVSAGPSRPAGSTPGTGGDGGDAPAPAPADAPGSAGSGAPPALPVWDTTSDEEPAPALVEDELLNAVLILGLSGVAAVAVIGAALLFVGRRRATEEEASVPLPERADTEALLERRTVRQARVRLTDDPIVAAMGIDDQVAARRQRRRAGQTANGPGERRTRGRP